MPPIRDLFVLAAILVSLPVCFLRPFYGVGLWTVIGFLNPHRMAWGMARDFPVALLVAVATLAGFLVFEHRLANLGRRESVIIFLLWAWFATTTIVTTHIDTFQPHAAATWDQFGFVSKILLMTVVAIGVVDSWSRLRRFLLCIAGAFGVLVVKLLPWMIITRGADRAYGPPGTMIADNNDLGLALDMTFPIFFYLAKSESNSKLRGLCGFFAAITVPAVFLTWSRGALLGLIAVVGFCFWGSKQKALITPILVLGAVLGISFTSTAWQDRMKGIVNDPADRSIQGRYNAWHFSWNLAMDYPITGGGFATFTPELFTRYAPNPKDFHAPHSIYFGILGEQGFVGLGLYLALLVSCLVSLQRLKRNALWYGDEKVLAYARLLQGSLIGFMVSGAFLGRHYFDYFFDIVAAVVMLKAAHEAEALEIESDAAEIGADEDISMEPLPGGLF